MKKKKTLTKTESKSKIYLSKGDKIKLKISCELGEISDGWVTLQKDMEETEFIRWALFDLVSQMAEKQHWTLGMLIQSLPNKVADDLTFTLLDKEMNIDLKRDKIMDILQYILTINYEVQT